MKNISVLLIFILGFYACKKDNLLPIEYVDPMIGTDGIGHTFPGATVPFGMVQLSPSNDFKAWNWCSGYHYSDSILKGFAHTHISGAGLAGLGDILLMPTTGAVHLIPGTEEDPDSGYRSRFSHDKEEATPGYYSVVLDDYDVKVELTASKRVGCHRYTPINGGALNVIIDPTHHIMERVLKTEIQYISDTELQGFKKCEGEGGERTVYFYAKFSTPFDDFGITKNDVIKQGAKKQKGANTKAYVSVKLMPKESLEVQVALSFVSYEGAKANFNAEVSNKSFNDVLQLASANWTKILDKITVQGNSLSDKRIFYTGIYHSFISPNLISDVDGKYWVEGKEFQSDIPQYSNYSTWDTYRALNPLFTIIEQEKTAEFVNSLASRYTEAKVGLPVWECLGHDNVCMIGYNAVSPMADAILKDIKGINTDAVYQAVRAAAMSLEKHSPNYDKNGMEQYIQLGYVPAELNCAVSKTTEQNYYDWCISQLAKKMGYGDDAALFAERSVGYRNLYHPEHKYLYSKYLTGEWREMDRTGWEDLVGNYVSGNIWGYSAYVPHDLNGLTNLMGGKAEFASWLDAVFNDTTHIRGDTHVDISGFIGKYGHGDEPSHHMPYLYNYVGQAWKTQKYARQVMSDFYQDKPDGMINNDDLGQMSAWYIFSALGFYPVCPGDLNYIIGSPLFQESTINLENGKQFIVKTNNNSKKNIYVQSATLNGTPYTKSFISHQQIMQGGQLVFEMGSRPNKNYGAKNIDMPISEVKLKEGAHMPPKITYKPFDINKEEVFEGNRKVELSCNTPEAEIYYTLNGKTPTKRSKRYKGEFNIRKTSRLRAIAYAADLLPSFGYDRKYYEGRSFKELDEGYPKLSLENKAERFGNSDGSMLLDRKIGSLSFNDGKWTGWDGKNMVATIDFGKLIQLKNIEVGYLSNTGVWIFPPSAITIYTSDDNKEYAKVSSKRLRFSQSEMEKPFVSRHLVKLKRSKVRYLKIKVDNYGLIPAWHAAAGHTGWMFIDEILIN